MERKRLLLAAALLLAVLLTGGCWDRKEIENRGYVLGAAIDYALPEPKGRYDLDRAFQQVGTRRYRLSYELRKFKGGNPSEKASSPEENLVYFAEGESLFAVNKAINSKAEFGMFIEDMQVMLISEAVAREGIMEIFDLFARDPEMRRRAKIFVTKGRAEDFFKLKAKAGEVNSLAFSELADNVKEIPTMGAVSEFGYFSEALRSKQGFSAPVIYLEKDEVKAAGAALFNRKGQLAGIADEYETIGGRILRKKLGQGLIVVPNPDKPETIVVFEIFQSKTTIKPDFGGDTVRFIIDGEFIGSLGESIPMQEKPFSNECLQALEQAVAAELTNHTYAALKKAQAVRADAVEFGGLIRRKNPQYWERIKDRWEEEIFPTVEAEVKIKAKIRDTGMTR